MGDRLAEYMFTAWNEIYRGAGAVVSSWDSITGVQRAAWEAAARAARLELRTQHAGELREQGYENAAAYLVRT